ncbi:MAG TPA: SMI1/KNR4 family protein [Anaeromyxobacter sp.]|nr:SMI1/KNR4 family protein [Anaeromyxobacter sp.]
MTAWEIIQQAAREELVDEEGAPVGLATLPGLSAAEIDELEEERGFRLPGELRALLVHCSGLEGPLQEIDFTGRLAQFGFEEAFPRSVGLAGDGSGNHWILDASPEGAPVAPVFFACHDPPVVLFQSPSLAAFLSEVFRLRRPPHESLLNAVQDELVHVWSETPGAVTVAEAARRDPVLQEFAAALDERWRIVDLRAPEVGTGFPWFLETPIRRHGDHRIFAYARPEKRSLWARIFRR